MDKEKECNKLNFMFHTEQVDKAREILKTFGDVVLTEGIEPTSLVKIQNREGPTIYGVCPENVKPEIVTRLSREKIAAYSLRTKFSSWRAGDEIDLTELRERE